jgi:hypothetical protein
MVIRTWSRHIIFQTMSALINRHVTMVSTGKSNYLFAACFAYHL